MVRDRHIYRESHLTTSHWNNIPEKLSPWSIYNNNQVERTKRDVITNQISIILNRTIFQKLTLRQKEVMELYFLEGYTQQQTAKKLGISQPTVNQHLSGKRRQGKKVGGACKRIIKFIRAIDRKQTEEMWVSDIHVIMRSMIDPDISRRQLWRAVAIYETACPPK